MANVGRRDFLKAAVVAGAAGTIAACAHQRPAISSPMVAGLKVPPMDVVRVAFIGVGKRGIKHVGHLCNIDGVEIKAVCDTDSQALDAALSIIVSAGRSKPLEFGKRDYSYRDLLSRDDIDLVIISTPWRWHTPMAVETMQSGKHVLLEVPAATTIEEAWQLVDTAERTQKNCMMAENVCYGREELMVLNMVRDGLFGDLLHGEAAYIHDLRDQMKEIERGTGSWRTEWQTRRNANLYPTHGLGPIAVYMGINRGDRFDYISSMGSPALGRAQYAQREFEEGHDRRQLRHIAGDINSSIIKTALGRTIMLQYDTTSPRPYTRHNLIQGTNGIFAGFPDRIALERGGTKSFHEWDCDMGPWIERYEHSLWRQIGSKARRQGGHGGMDFVMFWRVIHCLRNGEPLDQDVYDAAAWSVVTPLSEASVNDRGNSKDFPDFTRGRWQTSGGLRTYGEAVDGQASNTQIGAYNEPK